MKRTIFPLYAPADADAVEPILDALKAQGCSLRDAGGSARPGDALLVFLSRNVTAQSPEADAFFRLQRGRKLIVPVALDGSAPPLEIMNALMARHTLDGQKYGCEELAERIARAVEVERKNRLPLILSLAAAVILMAAGGIVLWRSLSSRSADAFVNASSVPAAPATQLPRVEGIEVDPAEVAEVVYVGNTFRYYTMADGYVRGSHRNDIRSFQEVAYESWENDGVHYYSTENGQEIPMGELGDVSYLKNLTNLMYVTFVNVRGELPDLSGLRFLQIVTISNCDFPSLQGLAGSHMHTVHYLGSTVQDLSSLNDSSALYGADIHLLGDVAHADLSSFHPRDLEWLSLSGAANLPQNLSACTRLRELHLTEVAATDLSFLNGTRLNKLWLNHMDQLTSLEGLQGMPGLTELQVEGCRVLRDISALKGMKALTAVHFSSDPGGYAYLKDVSVLGTLPWLKRLGLYGVNVADLDFLKELGPKKSFSLGFCINGNVDYSGLAAIDDYSSLHVNTCGNYALAAPYLQDKTVRQLTIYDGGTVDLSTLPNVTEELELVRCNNQDLTGMRELSSVKMLRVESCPYFTSFRGIESLPHTGQRGSTLVVKDCPRLTDWSAVEGKSFHHLELMELFTLPDFNKIAFNELSLGKLGADVLPDLSCLKAIDDGPSYSFRFEDLPQLKDLSPLFRLHGNRLDVPPQVGEQAQGLVDDGRFVVCEIVYPNGSWDPGDLSVQLSRLEELDALPPSLLKHVKSVTIIGDVLVDDQNMSWWSDWSTNPPAAVLTDRATGEQTRIEAVGTLFTDLSRLSVLTGLEELNLWYQPLTSLDGIQALTDLERLNVMFCPQLTDVSAAFTLQSLKEINFERCPVASLQGVQNLYDLEMLEVCNTKITSLEGIEGLKHLRQVRVAGTNIRDFSPLGQVDFTYAMTQDRELGVSLALNVMSSDSLPQDAYAFLEGIPGFSQLELHNVPAKMWADHLAGKPVKRLNADDCGFTNEQFKAFVEAHPELEEVSISWTPQLTDISCLLNLENLRKVRLSSNMAQAIASLGEGYTFELHID